MDQIAGRQMGHSQTKEAEKTQKCQGSAHVQIGETPCKTPPSKNVPDNDP